MGEARRRGTFEERKAQAIEERRPSAQREFRRWRDLAKRRDRGHGFVQTRTKFMHMAYAALGITGKPKGVPK